MSKAIWEYEVRCIGGLDEDGEGLVSVCLVVDEVDFETAQEVVREILGYCIEEDLRWVCSYPDEV